MSAGLINQREVIMNTLTKQVPIILNEDELVFLSIALSTVRNDYPKDIKKFEGFQDLRNKIETAWEKVLA
jgi:hypothetical protein